MEVTFDIDANGILNVSATDKGTGKEQRITITASSGLSQDEIEQMIDEAEQHAEEDIQKREMVEIRNTAQSAVFAAETLVKENAEHIDASLKGEVEQKILDLKTALEGDDNTTIESALQQLQESLQKIGQEVYSKTGEAPGAPPEEENSSAEDPENTVEGEFREV